MLLKSLASTAAGILRSRTSAASSFLTTVRHRPNTIGFVVCFPDVPEEEAIPDEGKLLIAAAEKSESPNLAKIDARTALLAATKSVFEFDLFVSDHCDKIRELKAANWTFESVMEPLVRELTKTEAVLGMARQLDRAMGQGDEENATIALRAHNALHQARFNFIVDFPLRVALKELENDTSTMNTWQRLLVMKLLKDGGALGMDKTAKNKWKLRESRLDLSRNKNAFLGNISASFGYFDSEIWDVRELEDAPHAVLRRLAYNRDTYLKGPWRVRMKPELVFPFLLYCGDSGRRAQVWQRWISQAAFSTPYQNNSSIIENIRFTRSDVAKELGFESYVHFCVDQNMAGNPKTVDTFLSTLRDCLQTEFQSKLKKWKETARLVEDGLRPQVDMADYYYYCRKHAERQTNLRMKDLANYFPLDSVWKGMQRMAARLFGLVFEELEGPSELRYQEDVRVFRATDTDSGAFLGHLCLDPFVRDKKIETISSDFVRHYCPESRLQHLIFIMLPLEKPPENIKEGPFLSWEELAQFFNEFGKCVEELLSESPFGELVGSPALEMDAVEVIPKWSELLLLQPPVLVSLSPELSVEEARRIRDCVVESSFYELFKNVFLSDFDQRIHLAKRPFWLDIYRAMWKDYFQSPWPKANGNFQPCSFTPIFTENTAGVFYSGLWSEMVACDIMSKFEEVGWEDGEKLARVGRELKREILAPSGMPSFAKKFHNFRGRNPSLHPFCQLHQLKLPSDSLSAASQEISMKLST